MHAFIWITSRRVGKGSLAFLFGLVFLSLFPHLGAVAQQAGVSAAKSFEAGTMSQPKNDVTLTGTVQQVIEKAAAGGPAGVQLIAEGPQGTFITVLGAGLSNTLRQSLVAGAPISASGASATINGNSYLIVRRLTVSGNSFIIRNEHGFAVHAHGLSRASVVKTISGGAK
jgi:hypothetical protein